MNYSIIIVLAALLYGNNLSETDSTPSSTTSTFESKTIDSNFNRQFHIQYYHPYCGGAAPTKEMMNNFSPASGKYILINKSNQTGSIVTAKNGIIKLKPGQYVIRETYKNIPFDEFYLSFKKEDSKHHRNNSMDCYKKWWKSNLFEFEITDTTSLLNQSTILYNKCFTGNNPCLT